MVNAIIAMKLAKYVYPFSVFLSLMLLPALHAADSSVDGQKQAAALKAEGDRWVARDNYESAAKAYERALLADRKSFSLADRTQMAVHMSWGDRLDAAARELRAVVDEEPKNIGARVHLARVLTWRGELAEGIEQSDMVLKELPDLRDALMVKADALQWQGRYSEAIPLYQMLVAKDGSFDARAGLTR